MNKAKVCVIDDDAFYTEILLNLLEIQGFETLSFLSSKQALEKLLSNESEQIDAIILDVMMPEMNGYELCMQLRQTDRYQFTPILFVSSKNSLDDRIQGYDSGGNDYLAKPVPPDELKSKLDLAIQNARDTIKLASQVNASHHQVQEMMSGMNQMQTLMDYILTIYRLNSLQPLTSGLIATLECFGLQGSVLLKTTTDRYFSSTDHQKNPIELELLNSGINSEEWIAFKSHSDRFLLNNKNISLLIKNLKYTDNEDLERFKKLLKILVYSTQSKIDVIQSANHHVNTIPETLIEDNIQDSCIQFNEKLLELALEKDQESFIKEMFKEEIAKFANSLTGKT
jgi:CheY-like chemotaxis protein